MSATATDRAADVAESDIADGGAGPRHPVAADSPEYGPHAPSVREQCLAGREASIVWILVDEVEAAFRAEGASLSGKALLDHVEVTNATLRTAWPFVLHELHKARP